MAPAKMKFTGNTDLSTILSSKALNPSPDSDPFMISKLQKPPRRKTRNAGHSGSGVRLRRDRAPEGKRSRPETPLLHCKFGEREKHKNVPSKEGKSPPEFGRSSGLKVREIVVSARRLAAVLWQLQTPEINAGRGGEGPKSDWLGFQFGAIHIVLPFRGHHHNRAFSSQRKDLVHSPCSVSDSRNGYLCKLSNFAMEGVTKWDPVCLKASDEILWNYGHSKHLDQQVPALSAISALKVELEQARACIHEMETERQSSKKKLEHFLKKLSEERATWRSKEHEKIRTIIDDVKVDLNRVRKSRHRLETVNSKLVSELAEAKLLAKRYKQDYEKELKARELIEEVCDELAKEMEEDKAEVEALKRESMKLCEEVEEERKMLQMAEVWREERVQMKLVDAKVTLEEKYSQMNKIVEDLDTFLRSRSAIPDTEEMRIAEYLRKTAASVNIQEIKEFVYLPPNPNDIFSVFEDVNFVEANEREIEQKVGYSPASHASNVRTVSPKYNVYNNDRTQRHSNAYLDQNVDIEEDGSGWETVSNSEDQGSSYSPNESDLTVNKICRDSNVCLRVEQNGKKMHVRRHPLQKLVKLVQYQRHM
ncbi:hypothetical protein CEY00_Acc21629 [Actinidia chinensis var. chinensis]|uniref:Uncharacterized protein n=1 Tax=Actinidia chinensis var. chinensis TaxID=1590841 RepID=A0A2R6PRC4_ACTCC|nr:hypothetical protein CEY00_Acc21629 [Actinidia chinensis var. chinensis]